MDIELDFSPREIKAPGDTSNNEQIIAFNPEEIASPEEEVIVEEEVEEEIIEEITDEIIEDDDELKTQEQKQKKTKVPPPSTDTQQNVPDFSLIFKSLMEEGNFSSFDETSFKENVEKHGAGAALSMAFQAEANAAREEIRAEADEDLAEYAALKDMGYSSKEAQQLVGSKIKHNSVTEEQLEEDGNSELRRQIIFENYKATTRLTDAKINSLIDKMFDAGEDIAEAKDSLNSLKEADAEALQNAKAEKVKQAQEKVKREQEAITAYKNHIKATTEVVEGVKISPAEKAKLEKYVFSGTVWKEREKDPVKFDTAVAYVIMNGLLDGKMDKVKKVSKSKALEEFDSKISTTTPRTTQRTVHEEVLDTAGQEAILNALNTTRRKTF